MSNKIINQVRDALKLVSGVEEDQKEEGVRILDRLLAEKDRQLIELGYDQVILKELIKLVQFDSGPVLKFSLDAIESHYFDQKKLWDELAETMIYRVARTNDGEICRLCLEKISTLVDRFDESIAKHSKQLLKLADLNDNVILNPLISEILVKMRDKLPKRRLAAT